MTGTIFLAAQEISVSEADGAVLVAFERTGDLSGEVTITFGITPDTATDGADYEGYFGTVVLQAGVDRVAISVDILNDLLGEATESFVVSLINVDSGFIDAPRTTRVSILDDENPVTPPIEPPLSANYDVDMQGVVFGLDQPMKLVFSPTAPGLALVAEKGGLIRTVDMNTGQVVDDFLDLREQVNNIQDRGLMDIAFHPDLENNPYFYAYYVVDPPGAENQSGAAGLDGNGNRYAHVVRYTLDAATNYTSIVQGSEVVIVGAAGQSALDISGGGAIDSTDPANAGVEASDLYLNPNGTPATIIGGFKQDYIKVDSLSHVGGALAFGPDGALYVSIGDGVSFNFADPRITSVQDLNSLAGKILRIDAVTGEGLADNPFVTEGMALDSNAARVYQLGVRNPFTMGFDQDGRLFFTETGWNTYEELNTGGAGANFGWPWYEGGDGGVLLQTGIYRDFPEADDFYLQVQNGEIIVTPAYRAFAHESALPGYQVQAITGGDVIYDGDRYPARFLNDFFFVDHSQGELYSIDTNNRQEIEFLFQMPSGYGPVHLTQGPDGYIYYVDLVTGTVGRLIIDEIEIDPNAFHTSGSARAVEGSPGEYVLTDGQAQVGAVTAGSRINLLQDFTITAQMYFGVNNAGGGDGAGFVLQNAGPTALGDGGGGLGLKGIANGLAIIFDTYSNPESGEIANDSTSFLDTDAQTRTAPFDLGNIEDGVYHDIVIAWNAATQTLLYTVDGAVIASLTNSNFASTYFGGASMVHFGFTGATGGAWNDQRVRIIAVEQGENDAPIAGDDAFDAESGVPLTLAASTLLANDDDGDDDTLSIVSVGSAVNGVVALVGGQVTFTANAGFVGAASFSYTVSDGNGGYDVATVAFDVTNTALPPFQLSGSAAAAGGDLFLLTDAQFETGAVMSTGTLDLDTSFTITFEMNFGASNGGGDGAAFVLHNSPAGAGATGTNGSGLGVGGISNGLAILFDTYGNTENGDIANDSTAFLDTDSLVRSLQIDLGDIEDGAYHEIVVAWNATTSTLTYSIDGAIVGAITDATLAATYFGGADAVHFGWTGATGGAFADQRVRVISVVEGGGPPAPTYVVSGSATDLSAGEYRLTDAAWQAGGVMSAAQLSLASDFTIGFEMFFGASDGGADGASFILHNAPGGAGALGQNGGGGLGVGGVANGLAIIFDTYSNAELGEIANDSSSFFDTDALTRTNAIDLGNIEDNAYHDVLVSWNASTATLTYTLDGLVIGTLTDAALAATYFGGASSVYFGFAAATGGAWNDQRVRAIDVDSSNDGPVAGDDAYAIDAGAPFTVAASALLADDSDGNGGTLSVVAVRNAVNGVVSIESGVVTFTPAAGYSGAASFEYVISDGQGGYDVGRVALDVQAASLPPYVFSGSTVALAEGEYRLTDAAWQAGTVASSARIDLAENFTIAFELYFGASDGGADGITFMLHPGAANAVGQNGGSGLGAGGIANGLAIVFDTYQNTELGEIAGDSTSFFDTDTLVRTAAVDLGNIENGAYHSVVVSWNAATATLSYSIDGVVVGSLTDPNLANTYFGGSELVRFGFTGATGGAWNDQRVRAIEVDATFEGQGGAQMMMAASAAPDDSDAFVFTRAGAAWGGAIETVPDLDVNRLISTFDVDSGHYGDLDAGIDFALLASDPALARVAEDSLWS